MTARALAIHRHQHHAGSTNSGNDTRSMRSTCSRCLPACVAHVGVGDALDMVRGRWSRSARCAAASQQAPDHSLRHLLSSYLVEHVSLDEHAVNTGNRGMQASEDERGCFLDAHPTFAVELVLVPQFDCGSGSVAFLMSLFDVHSFSPGKRAI